MDRSRHPDAAGIAIAALLALIAAVVFWDTSTLQLSPAYGVGPKAMPILVAAGLAALAVGNAVLAWRGDFPEREGFEPRPVALILGGLVALIAIIGLGVGFIAATAVLLDRKSTRLNSSH